MKDLFIEGGVLFMGILTVLLIVMVVWMIFHLTYFINSKESSKQKVLRRIEQGKAIGLFALIIGILGQLIGMYTGFSVVAEVGDIAPSLMYAGIKVSMITTIYGLIIYLISIALWFGGRQLIEKR